jgi:hypothetical protein
VLGTTRRRDAGLTGAGRVLIDIAVFTRAESLAYLTGRLTAAGQPGLLDAQAGALAGELGDLPLALSHAAAYMLDQRAGCAAYLGRFQAGRDRLDDLMPATADADGYGRTVAATLLLALDAALWATDAAVGYLTAHSPTPLTPGQGCELLMLLHRYALADVDGKARAC